VQARTYFVSDETENAARGDALKRWKEAKEAANLRAIEMGKIGKKLELLSRALQDRQSPAILAETEKLRVIPGGGRAMTLAEVTRSDLDFDSLHALISEYQEAIATRDRLGQLLEIE
jgi:hypothetical protein